MPRETGLELKVGSFMVLGLVALVLFVFWISDFSVFTKGQEYKVLFSYANGLRRNAPVRLAGVDAGHIRDIRVYFDSNEARTMVAADVWVNDGVRIPPDSRFLVNQLGLMGEKYLEIMPGHSLDVVSPGAVFAGDDPIPMEDMMRQMSSLSTKVEATLTTLNQGILNPSNQQAFAATLANLALLTEKMKNGEGALGMFMTDKALYRNLEEMTADLKANPWKLFYRPKGK